MRRWRRPSAALALSLVLHVVLGAGLVALLIMPHTAVNWLHLTRGEPPVVERIGFIAMPKTGSQMNPGKAGGDNRPVSKTKPKELVAPVAVPNALPSAPATPSPTAAQPEGGAGQVIGQGGATQGVAPVYSDPRVWVPPASVPTAPKSVPQRYDSALAGMVKAHNDSMEAIAKGEEKAGDWTFGKNKDWGINQKWIKLGPVQLPTALLGLLPLNSTGNPVLGTREAQLNAMHADIQHYAQRAMDEDQFNKAVKEQRQRRDRERALQQNQKPKDDTPTLANSGSREPVIPQP